MTVLFTELLCPCCGITFRLPTPVAERRARSRKDLWCPNGQHNPMSAYTLMSSGSDTASTLRERMRVVAPTATAPKKRAGRKYSSGWLKSIDNCRKVRDAKQRGNTAEAVARMYSIGVSSVYRAIARVAAADKADNE